MDKGEKMTEEENYTAEEKQQMFNAIAIKIIETEEGKRAIANLEQKKMEKENIENIRNHKFKGPCSDQWVGCIINEKLQDVDGVEIEIKESKKYKRDSWAIFKKRKNIFVETENYENNLLHQESVPKIIIVLESPHSEEYDEKLEPIGPAAGWTGSNIINYLNKILKKKGLINKNCYNLILINAIRYQSSLGVETECFRDQVFHDCWNNFGRNDFNKRLGAIYKENDIIINAATKGNILETEIRILVEMEIAKLKKKLYLQNNQQSDFGNLGSDLKLIHPSMWDDNGKLVKYYEWSKILKEIIKFNQMSLVDNKGVLSLLYNIYEVKYPGLNIKYNFQENGDSTKKTVLRYYDTILFELDFHYPMMNLKINNFLNTIECRFFYDKYFEKGIIAVKNDNIELNIRYCDITIEEIESYIFNYLITFHGKIGAIDE